MVDTAKTLQNSNVLSGENVAVDKNAYTVVSEGKVDILFPSSADVFYNPVQEFNRDISVLAVQVFADEWKRQQDESGQQSAGGVGRCKKQRTERRCDDQDDGGDDGIRVLEALAASGLRSCRFAREVEGVSRVLACDLSASAVNAMKVNIAHNGVSHLVSTHHGDASLLMHSLKRRRYNVIDIDPYGTPVPFLDSAVQAVSEGGMLQVTCTDMGVLCGASPATCYSKYGALSSRSVFCHEMAIRIALQSIEAAANRYGRHIVPLLSLSVDFYIRMFIRVFTSPATVRLSCTKSSRAHLCSACHTWRLQPLCTVQWNGVNPKFSVPTGLPSGDRCPHCQSAVKLCGPLWSEAIHDVQFVRKMLHRLPSVKLSTGRRIEGVLSVIEEELPDTPFYYEIAKLANVCKLLNPPMKTIWSALLNSGHRVSSTHCCPRSLKTDAPPERVWQILRAWEQSNPVKRQNLHESSPGAVLLSTPATADVDFTLHEHACPQSRQKQLCRFQPNPEPNWGPKSKGKTSVHHDNLEEKRTRNQGKRRKHGKTRAVDDSTESADNCDNHVT